MKSIHLNTARKILDAGDPVDLKVWTKEGDILEYKDAVCISSHFRGGTRRIKLLNSNEIRSVRDVCIFNINDLEVFL